MENIVFALLAVVSVLVHGEVLQFTSNLTVLASENTELVCRTTGIPDYSSTVIYWVRSSDAKTITFKNHLADNGDDLDEPGVIPRYSLDLQTPNEYTVKITDAKYLDSGKWVCTSGNSEAVWLTVKVPPEITYITEDFFAEPNITKILQCTARGNPTPVITWIRYGNTLPGGDVMFHGSELKLVNMTSSDRGTYQCVASNTVGRTSATVKVIMNHEPNVTITTPVVGAPINGIATLVCEYEAYPPVDEVIWLHNGMPVGESGDFEVTILTNSTKSTLVFGKVRSSQYGQYECRVSDLEGSVTETIQFIEAQKETTPSSEEESHATVLTASTVYMLMVLFTTTRLYFARQF